MALIGDKMPPLLIIAVQTWLGLRGGLGPILKRDLHLANVETGGSRYTLSGLKDDF